MKHHKFSERSIERMGEVDTRLVKVAVRALELSPIDFGIPEHGGARTVEVQQQLFADDKSKCDGILKKSYHQSGNALDFYAYVKKEASWNRRHMFQIAAAFLQAANELGYRLEWGGLWTSWQDYPHVQLVEE